VALFQEILADSDFRADNFSTAYLPDFLARRKPRTEPSDQLELAVALAAAAHAQHHKPEPIQTGAYDSRWLTEGRGQLLR
jgi:hypothetical protein